MKKIVLFALAVMVVFNVSAFAGSKKNPTTAEVISKANTAVARRLDTLVSKGDVITLHTDSVLKVVGGNGEIRYNVSGFFDCNHKGNHWNNSYSILLFSKNGEWGAYWVKVNSKIYKKKLKL